VLREAKEAGFAVTGAWCWRRFVFCDGPRRAERGLTASAFARIQADQRVQAVCVLCDERRRWWWCRDRFWCEDDDLSPQDVFALVYERDARRRRRLDRAHTLLATRALPESAARREVVPRELRRAVFERDGGRCVECGARFDLQYDHVIPLALGGASTLENLQILCAPCNASKGAAL
jgi:hypothetical protein